MNVGNQACIGQMSLFDLFPTEQSENFNPISAYAMKGSLSQGGKQRIPVLSADWPQPFAAGPG